jgi:hypothetical protein
MQGIALQFRIRQDIINRVLDQRDMLRFGDHLSDGQPERNAAGPRGYRGRYR